MSEDRFREIRLSGDAYEIGYLHGKTLENEIHATIDFYGRIFHRTQDEIRELANHFKQKIREFHLDYANEMESIADAANVDPFWIYALNSRSEILSLKESTNINECTALFFRNTALLGQTWDWGKPLEDLVVLVELRKSNDRQIQMLTEPGIIGKIGLNDYGMGTCLNLLKIEKRLDGVPIHIVLRSILDANNMDVVEDVVRRSGCGKASNIVVGHSSGLCLGFEFAGDETFIIRETREPYLLHTNHYLTHPTHGEKDDSLKSSYSRYEVANELASKLTEYSFDDLSAILADRSNCETPICRPYEADEDVEEMGTVATVIMDLKTNQLHIKKGNDPQNPFHIAFA